MCWGNVVSSVSELVGEIVGGELLEFYPLSGGMTNKLFKAKVQKGDDVVAVLIRWYGHGTEKFIDRESEILIMLHIGTSKVYGSYENGIVYEFTEGNVVSVDQVSDPIISAAIGKTLGAVWHSRDISDTDATFRQIKRYCILMPEESAYSGDRLRLRQQLPSKDVLIREVEALIDTLELFVRSPVVLSHCDLLPGNILYTANNTATFVDFEYARSTARGFDLGNHWCEWCGFYPYDATRYPWDVDAKRPFLEAYLKATQGTYTEADMQTLSDEGNAFSLLAHLEWSTWALLQEVNSDIDGNYLEFAELRIAHYLESRERALKPFEGAFKYLLNLSHWFTIN